jgi:alpha-tubulin suppressor-like RCC1 family protein
MLSDLRSVVAALAFALATAACGPNRSTGVVAQAPATMLDVRAIANGELHSCAVMADGSVRCWGYNDSGQLGFESNERCHIIEGEDYPCTSKPTRVPGLANVTAIVVGSAHTCALLADLTLRCWGQNRAGQIGDGPSPDRHTPTSVPRLNDVVQIVAGAMHTCTLSNDGTVRCWGYNDTRQLGFDSADVCFGIDSRIACSRQPTIVPNPGRVVRLMAGEDRTCAFMGDGTSRCWGGSEPGSRR